MDIYFLYFVLPIILVVLLTRLAPRLTFAKNVISSDTLFHLTMIRHMKRHGWYKTCTLVQSNYPLGFHWVMSFIPTRMLPLWEKMSGAVLDLLHVCIFIAATGYLIPGIAFSSTLHTAILLAAAPAWLFWGIAPRAYFLSERVFAELLISATFVSAWLYYEHFGFPWAVAAIFCGALLLNSSKFGAQVLWAFCVIIGASVRDATIVFIPILSTIMAILISRGTYLMILRGHLKFLNWYVQAVRTNEISISKRNSWEGLRGLVRRMGAKGAAVYILMCDSRSIALFHYFPILMAATLATFGIGCVTLREFPLSWMIAGVSLWLLTSTKRYLFIGEAERYLSNAILPSYVFLLEWLSTLDTHLWFTLLAVYSIAWSAGQLLVLNRFHCDWVERQPNSDKAELLEFLRSIPPKRLLPAGDVFFQRELAFETSHITPISDPRFLKDYTYSDIFHKTHYPPKWEALSLLDIELVTLNKVHLERHDDPPPPLDPRFMRLERIFDNPSYSVFATTSEQGVSAP